MGVERGEGRNRKDVTSFVCVTILWGICNAISIPYRTAVAVRPPEGHELRDARMGMPYWM